MPCTSLDHRPSVVRVTADEVVPAVQPRWMELARVSAAFSLRAAHDVAIAIPARNEAADIAACLAALDTSAARVPESRVSAVVFVNNSQDKTAVVARAVLTPNMQVTVVEAILAPSIAHAGGARRRALDLAAATLGPDGVLMTTDADSRVDRNWIAANLVEIEAGADAVAGSIVFGQGVTVPVCEARHAEWHLSQLQARLYSLIDPIPANRWPTHIWTWGAALAVTVGAYRAVGGLPEVPLAEDRALADLLDLHGFSVRRSHRPFVVTSHRRVGRAPGGFADLLSQYVSDNSAPCDAAIEPTTMLVRRLVWRAYLRQRHEVAGPVICDRMVRQLRIEHGLRAPDGFGHWWSAIEQASPRLARRRVLPSSLPAEIARAKGAIIQIERRSAHRSGSAASVHG